MTHRFLAQASLLALALFAVDAAAQRGGRRGPPPEVKERWGNYFVWLQFENDQEQRFDLTQTTHVKDAAAGKHLSLIYIFDSGDGSKKRPGFEQALFNNIKIQPGLRLFHCARFDLARNRAARKKFSKIAPAFFLFDQTGKQVDYVSMKGYHAVINNLVRILRNTVKGYSKVTFDAWIKTYGKWVRDLNNMLSYQTTLDGRRTRLDPNKSASHRKQLEEVDRDEAKLHKKMEAHYKAEEKLLARAKVPERNPDAEVVGEPRRGRR